MRGFRSSGQLAGKDFDPDPIESTPIVTPIKETRLAQIAGLLHFRRSSLENATSAQKTPETMAPAAKIEAPITPTGGEAKG